MSMDAAEDVAAAIIARWRTDRDFSDLAEVDREVLLDALRIVGEYDAELLAGVALAAFEPQARRAPVIPIRRRGDQR